LIRKLLLLIAALVALPASALDGVSFYGKLDLGYSHIWAAGPWNKDATDLIESGQLSGSRVGIKLTEPLTEGFNFTGQAEAGLYADQSDLKFTNRQAYAGISHPLYGKLTLGRHATPQYFLMSDVDPFEIGTVGDMSTLVKRISRTSNSIQYTSPKYLGLEVTGLYSTTKVDSESAQNVEDVPGWMAAARWSGGPVLLGASYYQDRDRKSSVWSRLANAGGTLDLKYVKLAGYGSFYESGLDTLVSAEQAAFMAGVFVPAGPGSLRLSYSHLHDMKASADDSTKYAAGYIFNWTKTTDLYAAYAHIQNFGSTARVFDDTDNTKIAAGNNGLSLGIRHAF
jgi:predicted porin